MQVILPVIIIGSSEEIDLVFNKYAIVTGSWREIALISRHDLFPFTDLHIHKVLVSKLWFELLVLLLSSTTRHCNRHE